MKKISDWFNELPEPQRTQALANVDKAKRGHFCVRQMSTALMEGFEWANTPQGYEYWNQIHISYKK